MVPSFTVSQSAISPQNVTITDTSTAVTGSIVSRRLYISDSQGNYLTGNGSVNYNSWALADASYLFTGLQYSLAANIKTEWIDVSGNIVETLNANYPLSEFSRQFAYGLVQNLGLTPGIYMDTNFSANLAQLWSDIIGGDNAVTYGNDIAAAQDCYNRANEKEQNESYYF